MSAKRYVVIQSSPIEGGSFQHEHDTRKAADYEYDQLVAISKEVKGTSVRLFDRQKNEETPIRIFYKPTEAEEAADRDRWITRRVDEFLGQKALIDAKAAKLVDNPHYEMQWMDKTFEAAAKLQTGRLVKSLREREEPLSWDQIAEYLREQVMQGAHSPERSTSVTSNFYNRCRLSAMAEMLRTIEGGV